MHSKIYQFMRTNVAYTVCACPRQNYVHVQEKSLYFEAPTEVVMELQIMRFVALEATHVGFTG